MKDTTDSKKFVGKFVGRYISLAFIIGVISFALENVIPQFVDWDFTATLMIYQSVLFIISTLLAIILAVNLTIKKQKLATREDAKKASKPIKIILIFVALMVMIANLVYCYQIEQSGYKDVDQEIEKGTSKTQELDESEKEEYRKSEKDRIHLISNMYMATREIVTILTYAYAVIYVEKMIEISAIEKNKKEE